MDYTFIFLLGWLIGVVTGLTQILRRDEGMGAIEKAIDKYCRVTNSKFIGYNEGYYYFLDGWGEEKSYRQKTLLREVSNFE